MITEPGQYSMIVKGDKFPVELKFSKIYIEKDTHKTPIMPRPNYQNHCLFQIYELQYTITQKMANQGRSDLDVVFTMILCATNLFIW